jgi:hypothetical protein
VFFSLFLQNKRKLCDAVGRVLSSVTDVLGSFVQEVGNMEFTAQDKPEPSLRRSKRHRTAQPPPANDDFLDEEEESDYEQESEEEEESDYASDSEDEDPGAHHNDGNTQATTPVAEPVDGLPSHNTMSGDNEKEKMGGDGRSRLAPIAEDNEGAHKDEASRLPNVSGQNQEEEEDEDNVPLIRRMNKIRGTVEQVATSVPLEILPSTHKRNLGERRARLRLPDATSGGNVPSRVATVGNSGQGCSLRRTKSADESLLENHSSPLITRSNSLDFTPPDFNLLKFVDESPENVSQSENKEKEKQLDQSWQTEPGSASGFDGFDEEFWLKFEQDALKKFEMVKKGSCSTGAVASAQPTKAAISVTPLAPPTVSPSVANSSVSPTYQPAPRRRLHKAAALQSPYVDFTSKKSFKCSKVVCEAYNAVLSCNGRPTRSRSTPNKE